MNTTTTSDRDAGAPTPYRNLVRAVIVAVALALALLMGSSSAQAMNPAPSNSQGVVTVMTTYYGGANDYWKRVFTNWGYRYTAPTVRFYNSATGYNFSTPCGSTANSPNNGFYCSGSHGIYLDYSYMQRLYNRFGDYAVGGFLAHEWGHAIDRLLGYSRGTFRGEYHADCLAGMSTRWGYQTGRLGNGDYWELHNWYLSTRASNSHGYPQQRADWYRYGYQTQNINSCNQVLN
jgi:predicted metalloprotease